ncbi:hypothetical protein FJ365_02470 [Candidatus Dependentiae bacterium]|nr:hypothetical protein [Candidatus Dependentiae bacterium]
MTRKFMLVKGHHRRSHSREVSSSPIDNQPTSFFNTPVYRIPDQGTINQSIVTINPAFTAMQENYIATYPNSLLADNFSSTGPGTYGDKNRWSKAALLELFAHPPLMATIQEMHLDGTEDIVTFLQGNMSQFTNLESLRIMGIGMFAQDNEPTSLTDNEALKLQSIPALKSLNLESCNDVSNILANLPATLERLIITNCTRFSLPDRLPVGLKVLAVNNNFSWHPTTLPACITTLPKLQELHVYSSKLPKQIVRNANNKEVTVYWEEAEPVLVENK